MIGWFDLVIDLMIQSVQWLGDLIQWLFLQLLLGLRLMIEVGPIWKIRWKVAYIFDVLSQVDLVWNIMKRGQQEVLRVAAFIEGVKASFE